MQIKSKFIKIIFVSSLLLGLMLASSLIFAQTYGLKFNGFNVSLDMRTELDLSSNGFLKFNDEFEISFDYKINRLSPDSNEGFFGYIFRVINQQDNNIDLLSTPTPGIGLNLVIGNSNEIIPIEYPSSAISNWIKLRVKFVLSEDRLIFYSPDTFYVHDNLGFKKQEELKIIFGANDYKHFKNSDVPTMTIKDIRITEKGKLKFHWMLNEKEGNIATDRIKGRKAKAINPYWLILNHQNWQKIYEDELDEIVAVTSDPETGRIFMVGKNNLLVYSTKGDIQKIAYQNESSFLTLFSRVIYNNNDKRIYCYELNKGPCYSINPNTGEWEKIIFSEATDPKYRHHNSYFHDLDNQIYLFGGYGLHKYSNDIKKIDLTAKAWVELPTDDRIFNPRYLAGLGVLNDTIYIFGGYGSESGNQLINPQSWFDLIGYSLKNGKLFKKFDVPHLMDDMLVGNTIHIDKKTRNYYALIYSKIKFNNELQLIRGNLDSPDVETVGDKIPFKFLDIRSMANLYYMPEVNKLYTYTSYSTDSTTQVAIYSIDNPPNSILDETRKKKVNNLLNYSILALILIVSTGVLMWAWKRRRKTSKTGSDSILEKVDKLTVEKFDGVQGKVDYHIILFGGFQVFNKDYKDITNKFSPLLKELFLLILLYTFKNNKGISSNKITEILWYDKSEKSARNNRSVNIAKLRSILEEIGECELTKKTGYWKIIFEGSDIKSDYVDFLNITASKTNLTKQNIIRLIQITEKGAFLSNVHYEWLDEFKATASDTIIDTLVDYGKSCDVKKESDFIIHLADSVFNFDLVNEDAMILKCQAEYCKGKHSLAKATYQRFFKEYMTMYGQEYEKAFLEILEIKE